MRTLYASDHIPVFCDKEALSLFEGGRRCFCDLGLKTVPMIQAGSTVHIFPWLGDRAVNTITLLLRNAGLKADCFSGIIEVRDADIAMCTDTIRRILNTPQPAAHDLANGIPNTFVEKHDLFVPQELRERDYGAKFFDVDGAWRWLSGISIL